MIKTIKRYIHRHYVAQEYKEHRLLYLFWEATLRCNLNCVHCGSDCHKNSTVPDMPLDDFLQVIDHLPQPMDKHSIVAITGGEPLLRADLAQCGRQIRQRGLRWGMVSNGYDYTEVRHNELLAAGMGSITISLDGLQDSHNWLRNNPKSFDRALRAIRMVAAEPRLTADVVTCVNKRNLHELPMLKHLLALQGVKAWRLFTITPIGRAREQPDLQLSSAEMRVLMDFIEQERQNNTMDIKLSCEGYVGREYENKVRNGFFFCRAGINIASVLANGDISACPNVDRSFVQGNIYTDNFAQVWEQRFEPFRDRSWMRTGACSTCTEFNDCKGNGFHYRNASMEQVGTCHYQLLNTPPCH